MNENNQEKVENVRQQDDPNPQVVNLLPTLRDQVVPSMGIPPVIYRSTIQDNNFELKTITLQLVKEIQFTMLPSENSNAHISNFLDVYDTIKYNVILDEVVQLRLFPFSLRYRAKN